MKKSVVRRFRCGKVKFEKDVYQRKIEDAGKVHRAEDQKYIESTSAHVIIVHTANASRSLSLSGLPL